MSAELIGKVDAMLRRLKRCGYISHNLAASDLLQNTDEDLFHKMRRPQHCLHHLLPAVHVVDKLDSLVTHSPYQSTILLSIRSPSLCVHCIVSFRELWLNCFANLLVCCDFAVICCDFILFYFSSCHPTLLVCVYVRCHI